jgi:NSS family neurotransmitter:Na+ symporter
MLIVLALFEVILFGWVLGVEQGLKETNRGSEIRVPGIFAYIIRYVCPTYLVVILGAFAYQNFPTQARAIAENPAALVTVTFMIIVLAFLVLMVHLATRRWERSKRFSHIPERAV